MKKKKAKQHSYLFNLDEIGAKYRELIGLLEEDMVTPSIDKRDPKRRNIVLELDIHSEFASSHIMEKYFSKNPAMYKEDDKDDDRKLSHQRITANSIVLYLRKKHPKIDVGEHDDLVVQFLKGVGAGEFNMADTLAGIKFRDRYINTNDKYKSMDDITKRVLANSVALYVTAHIDELKGIYKFI